MKTDAERIHLILTVLKKTYSDAKIALNYSSPWELLVAVILSAQCTDKMVNIITGKLFKIYKTLDDYVHADLPTFEQQIKSAGFYHNKAKNILATAKLIHENYNDKVPDSMEKLVTLPGVARKTANIVLGNVYNVVVGIPVDTHVFRLSQRLRLVNLDSIGGKRPVTFNKDGKEVVDFKKDADPNKVESELMEVIPVKDWFQISYLLIDHGRAVCKSQNPNCRECPLKPYCPSSRE